MRRLAFVVSFVAGFLISDVESAEITLFPYTNTWRYLDSGTNLGTSWREPGFDDQSWSVGAGAFSIEAGENLLGAGPIRTTLQRFINRISAPQVTNYYFRTSFNFTNSPMEVTLFATNVIDDGAVIYINGQEVGRFGMPAAPQVITATTFATRTDEISSHGWEILSIPSSALVQGTNVIAVEVHQGSSGSSDAAFAMRLTMKTSIGPVEIISQPMDQAAVLGEPIIVSVSAEGTAPLSFQWYKDQSPIAGATESSFSVSAATFADDGNYTVHVTNSVSSVTSRVAAVIVSTPSVPLLDFHSSWRYHAHGDDLGVSWREFEFDDSTWQQGPGALGEETAALAVPIRTRLPRRDTNDVGILTYYFRTTFIWDDSNLNATLVSTNMIDDGVVYYLNGIEVSRLGMPSGPITAATFAARTIGDASIEVVPFPSGSLRHGTNVLAAELHQANRSNSDAVFGMSLRGRILAENFLGVTSHPTNMTVYEGEARAVFSVGVEAGGEYSVQWFRDNVGLAGETNLQLVLEPVSVQQAGLYYVRANFGSSQVESQRARLTVLPRAEFRIVHFAHGAQTIASWKSAAGKEYRVETSSSLQPGSWLPVSGWILATGTPTYWTNTFSAEASSFYRVEKR